MSRQMNKAQVVNAPGLGRFWVATQGDPPRLGVLDHEDNNGYFRG